MPNSKELRDREIDELLRCRLEEWREATRAVLQKRYATLCEDEREEVLTQAIVRLWETAQTRIPSTDFQWLLTKIAWWKAKEDLREGSREKRSRDPMVPDRESPEDQFANHELREMLMKAIDELPEKERAIIVAELSSDQPSRHELSKQFGITVEMLRVRKSRAIKKLRARLIELGYPVPETRTPPIRQPKPKLKDRASDSEAEMVELPSTVHVSVPVDPIDYAWADGDYDVFRTVEQFGGATHANY